MTDDGIGIPKDKQKTIFEKFTQVDSPLQRKSEGTGLGLPIALQMVEKMGGNLELESEDKKGSRFFFSLPIADAETPLEIQAKGGKAPPES